MRPKRGAYRPGHTVAVCLRKSRVETHDAGDEFVLCDAEGLHIWVDEPVDLLSAWWRSERAVVVIEVFKIMDTSKEFANFGRGHIGDTVDLRWGRSCENLQELALVLILIIENGDDGDRACRSHPNEVQLQVMEVAVHTVLRRCMHMELLQVIRLTLQFQRELCLLCRENIRLQRVPGVLELNGDGIGE